MDPITAFSLAGTILQVIDIGLKAGRIWYEVHQSAVGATKSNEELGKMAQTYASTIDDMLRDQPPKTILGGIDLGPLAAKCRDAANSLVNLLLEIRGSESSNRTKGALRLSMQRTIRALSSKKKVDELRERLIEYQQLLEHQLLADQNLKLNALAVRNSESFDGLNIQGKEIIETLLSNEKKFDRIHDTVQAVDASIRAHIDKRFDELQRSSPISSLTCSLGEHAARRRILDSLYFLEMNERFKEVDEAQNETYQWIFNAPPEDGELTWTNFPEWLEKEHGFYWVCGDPGSGKSTLLKFVSKHRQTFEALHVWARGSQLLTASFFFWHSGSSLQKSQAGFLRSILYQIFHQAPELATKSTDLAELAAKLNNLNLHGSHQAESELWNARDLLDILTLLIAEVSTTRKYYLCLFLDALDEHDGDYKIFIETLKCFTEQNTMNNVKIIVSSRPWSIFEEAFREDAGLSLQLLTRQDMESYTNNTLHSHPVMQKMSLEAPSIASDLTKTIVDKAEGIFLWIGLIMPILLEELRHRPTWDDLFAAVNDYPRSLDGFYGRLLAPARNSARLWETASHYFQMMLIVHEDLRFLFASLLAFALAEEKNIEMMQKLGEEPPMSFVIHILERTEAKIRQCCAGLLKVEPGLRHSSAGCLQRPWDTAYHHMKVRFAHQTVVDYLQKENVSQELHLTTSRSRYSPYGSLMRSFLTQIRTYPSSCDIRLNCDYIIDTAGIAEVKARAPSIHLIDELRRTLADRNSSYTDDLVLCERVLHHEDSMKFPFFQGFELHARVISRSMPRFPYTSKGVPFIHYVLIGMYCTMEGGAPVSRSQCCRDSISWLLESGTDPNGSYRPEWPARTHFVTPWQLFLSTLKLHPDASFEDTTLYLSIIKTFLIHGADPMDKSWSSECPGEGAMSILDCLDPRCHQFEEVYQLFISRGARAN